MSTLVLGAGVSGRGAARLARRLGGDAVVYDRSEEALAEMIDEGFAVHAGDWSASFLEEAELVVTSPGFPEHGPPIGDSLAAPAALWSELEFASRHLDAPVAAITGTNGKTTVTALVADMAGREGRRATTAGNIGTALSDVVEGSWDLVTVEASSFQLRFTESFQPGIAALLNVVPDHLDWHGSFEAYADAKARIFANHGPDDVLVFDADDQGAAHLVETALSRLIPISGSRRLEGGGVEDGKLWVGDRAVASVPGVDSAFGLDLVAGAVVAAHAGVGDDAIAAAVEDFEPGPHRRTLVASSDGIDWVDDSKATNPHAALASAEAYPSVVLIAGGRNKGLDLTPLTEAATVKALIAVGEAASALAAASEGVAVVAGMDAAVREAAAVAEAGDTVLLAPGCASFDMYPSYAARGEDFSRAVNELVAS